MSSVSAPAGYSGCSIFGNNTGSCCTTFPVTFNISAGATVCQTSADRVAELQTCLRGVAQDDKNVACSGAASTRYGGGLALSNRMFAAGFLAWLAWCVVTA